MKINVNQISLEGLTREEEISPSELELESDEFKLRAPVKIKADVSRITNAVTVDLLLAASIYTECSRCLGQAKIDLNKRLKLNYQVTSVNQVIDINPDIREEIILDYPLNPLCKPDCKGLCPQCGQNLNEGSCCCGAT